MAAISKLQERFTEADIEQEIVIMQLDSGEFFSLSGTAADLWRLIDGRRDRSALLAAAATAFDVDQNEIGADIDEFLQQLREKGLLAAE